MDSISLEITELETLRDLPEIAVGLFETKRENVMLEAELAELVERNKLLSEAKSKLDDAVRRAGEKKVAERRALVDSIMAGVMTELKESKLQDRILKQALADLERIPVQSQL
jgi:small-conductance mechanosensitive channel